MMNARRGWSRLLPLVAVAGLPVVAAACGGEAAKSDEVASLDTDPTKRDGTDQSAPGSEAPKDPEEAMLAFTECMRDQGVEMPDPPAPGQPGEAQQVELSEDPFSEEFKEANAKCEPLLQEAMGDIELDPEEEAEMREQMLEFAECMREQGIDMPDPEFSKGRIEVVAGKAGGEDDVDRDEWEAAEKKCGGPEMKVVTGSGETGDHAGGGD